MILVVGVLLLVLLLVVPGWWVQWILKRHSGDRPDFPGTGADMARHLIQRYELDGVGVETTARGDHYDPSSRTVRLTDDKFQGKSLTAVVVAAHEVGHAMQHHRKETLFATRQTLAVVANWVQRLAPVALLVTPLLALAMPAASRWSIIVAVLAMLVSTLVHLVTLPVELDASFNKALPMLRKGQYLDDRDMEKAQSILRAAAYTYVAGSMGSLLNVGRWLRYLRR